MSGPTNATVTRVRPLLRTRQTREFTDAPVSDEALDAIADVGRWTGSARNSQPWRFIAIHDIATIRRLAEIGAPQTRSLVTATGAIAIVMPADESHAVGYAFDEGRVAERMLVAATLLDLGAGISWIRRDVLEHVRRELDIPDDRTVRTIVAVGHPSAAGRRPKSAPGEARLPRDETVHTERWGGTR